MFKFMDDITSGFQIHCQPKTMGSTSELDDEDEHDDEQKALV